jgi:cellulose synthase/poly-beta-1,6-N-acetylglucosamine synthase-like glycosyltransferase
MVLSKLLLDCYFFIFAALSIFGAHMGILLLLGRSMKLRRADGRSGPPPPVPLPRVTVQLPLYNERFVAERGIRAAAALVWPSDCLQIQVLDDSTDDTQDIVRRTVADLRAAGHDITLVHRSRRDGFKAGALAAGLPEAKGELIAMFDADFLPAPDFLEKLLGERAPFADPAVGFVQARWSYCNRDTNALTRAQAVMLDPHFFIEQPVRSAQGWPLSFNGSGGIWRRSCIEDAGGWQSHTLTEDLDLSYRARLRGWIGVYDGDVLAPNELPEDIFAFKRQQARWARGSIQCARQLLGPVWQSDRISFAGRLIATVHLVGYALHLFLVGFLLIWPLCQLMPLWFPGAPGLPNWLICFLPLSLFYPAAIIYTQHVQRGISAAVLWDFLVAAWLGIGLGFSNGVAVVRGAFGRDPGTFLRTPKSGGSNRSINGRYRVRADWTVIGELAMAAALCTFGAQMWTRGLRGWAMAPFFYSVGFLLILGMQLHEVILARQRPRSADPAPLLRQAAPATENHGIS